MVLMVKNPAASAGDVRNSGLIPEFGRSPGEGHGTHSSVLAWTIPWTREPARLWSMGLQRVRHGLKQQQVCTIFMLITGEGGDLGKH